MAPATPDWNALKAEISGDVILPDSPDYETVRKPAIATYHDVWPQAVVLCETPEDVSETISFARRSGLRTATRSGGHCFAGRSSTEGIVIDVTPMRSVSVSGRRGDGGRGCPARRGVRRAGRARPHHPGRLRSLRRDLRPHARRRARDPRPQARADLGSPARSTGRPGGRTHTSSATTTTTRTCSGRCAAPAAATSAWSRPSCSRLSLPRTRRPSTFSGPSPTRQSGHRRLATLGAHGTGRARRQPAPDHPGRRRRAAGGQRVRGHARHRVRNRGAARRDGRQGWRGPGVGVSRTLSYRETKRYLAELGDGWPARTTGSGGSGRRAADHPYSKSEFFRRSLPTEPPRRSWRTSWRGGLRASRASWTSRRGAAPTTAYPHEATAFAHREELFLLQHAVVVDAGDERRRKGGRAALADAVVGDGASVGVQACIPELPRPRPRRLAARLPRGQPRASGARQEKVRPGRLLPVPAIVRVTWF